MPLNLKTRREWFATPTRMDIPMLPVPVSYVFLNYTRKTYHGGKKSPGPRPTTDEIIDEILYIQRGDMHKYTDIRYNFMIGPDGCVYECRGWITVPTVPLQLTALSFKTLYIGYVGDYTDTPPPKKLFEVRDELIKYGVKNKFISKKFSTFTLRLPEYYKCPFEEYIY